MLITLSSQLPDMGSKSGRSSDFVRPLQHLPNFLPEASGQLLHETSWTHSSGTVRDFHPIPLSTLHCKVTTKNA